MSKAAARRNQTAQSKPVSAPAAEELTSKPKSTTTAIVKVHNGCLNRDLVEAKAHELWQARGGDALANWLEAEASINGQQK